MIIYFPFIISINYILWNVFDQNATFINKLFMKMISIKKIKQIPILINIFSYFTISKWFEENDISNTSDSNDFTKMIIIMILNLYIYNKLNNKVYFLEKYNNMLSSVMYLWNFDIVITLLDIITMDYTSKNFYINRIYEKRLVREQLNMQKYYIENICMEDICHIGYDDKIFKIFYEVSYMYFSCIFIVELIFNMWCMYTIYIFFKKKY